MANLIVDARQQFKRDTAAAWTANNPVLLDGEFGLESDTRHAKIGNGSNTWNELSYGGFQGPQGPTGAQGLTGPAGAQGPAGTNGATGPAGSTGAAGAAGTNGTNGVGVPTGGTTGQVLAKIDGTNYNTQWSTPTAPLRSSDLIGDGSSTSIVYTHGLGTRDVNVSLHYAGTPFASAMTDWNATTTNTITLSFYTAPAANALRVTVLA